MSNRKGTSLVIAATAAALTLSTVGPAQATSDEGQAISDSTSHELVSNTAQAMSSIPVGVAAVGSLGGTAGNGAYYVTAKGRSKDNMRNWCPLKKGVGGVVCTGLEWAGESYAWDVANGWWDRIRGKNTVCVQWRYSELKVNPSTGAAWRNRTCSQYKTI